MIALAAIEAGRLEELEAVIARGVRAFVDVGNALKQIHDDKLYRPENGGEHNTFDDYCRTRWGVERTYAHRMIESASVVERLRMLPIGNILPTTESQARELLRLKEPDDQAAAWQRVLDRSGADIANITAKIVREEVARFLPEKEEVLKFDAIAERDAIVKWLTARRDSWPEEKRPNFFVFVRGVLESMEDLL